MQVWKEFRKSGDLLALIAKGFKYKGKDILIKIYRGYFWNNMDWSGFTNPGRIYLQWGKFSFLV